MRALTRTLPARYDVAQPNVRELPDWLMRHPPFDPADAAARANIIVFLVAHSPFGMVAQTLLKSGKVVVGAVGLLKA